MKTKAVVAALVIFLGAVPALADWDFGDPGKWVQPPKVDGGWDVMSSYYLMLADDWQCTLSGPVTDIHTWVSFKNDVVFDPLTVHLAIWSDDPVGYHGIPGEETANNFSHPLTRLWHGDTTEWDMRPWGTGPQGWFDPRQPGMAEPVDHYQVYQMNFDIDEALAFQQQAGNIYWLEFTIQQPHEVNIGWKESAVHWNDDAVWRILDEPWHELVDPIMHESMDLAFVITTTIPEPATISLLALGVLALLGLRRRHS